MRIRLTFLVLLAALAGSLCADDGRIHTIQEGEWLSRLADRYYDDVRDWPAILLVTNQKLLFLRDPNVVKVGRDVWIPSKDDSETLNRLYSTYMKAVQDMALPQPWEISNTLVSIPRETRQCTVVAWTRKGKFRVSDTSTTSDTWVTLVPHLRDFCNQLEDRIDLTLRLEQRLGIPPLNGKTEFAEIVVQTDSLFRPCSDPDVHTADCRLGPPSGDNEEYQNWFYNQYYQSHASAQPSPYPWTALGYTYDWEGTDEHGESEFVIPDGVPIRVLSITPTDKYCAP